jgi:hypothetical protein
MQQAMEVKKQMAADLEKSKAEQKRVQMEEHQKHWKAKNEQWQQRIAMEAV